MLKKDESEIKTQRRIYQFIVKYPGLHKRELSRLSGIPYSTMDYHLYYLLKHDIIIQENDKRFVRYYAAGKIGLKDKKIMNILRQKSPRNIILYLLLHPHASHESLRNHLGLAPSTTSYHLKKLHSLEIIRSQPIGKESSYEIIDPEYMIRLLITFKSTLLSKTVDQFVHTIVDMHPKYLRYQKENKD